MKIGTLDHVNVRTAQLDAMIAWYGEMLGMTTGPRPGFDFPGAWLYADGHPAIHLVGVAAAPGADAGDLRIEHFALRARGLASLIDRVEAAGARYLMRLVPGFPICQVNLWDPDGNHIHIDFDSAEADGIEIVDGRRA